MSRKALDKWNTSAKNIIRRAYILTARAIRKKRILKPRYCKCCGKRTIPIKLHAHHYNYHTWWKVIWLCITCHKVIHRKGVYRKCVGCGHTFYIPHWRVNDTKRGKYCRLKCYKHNRKVVK